MALPAGRYGVTKRQLNKIKNLPVNTIGMIEEAVEGVTDLIEDTVGWLGGNLFDSSNMYANSYLKDDGTYYSSENWNVSDYLDTKGASIINIEDYSLTTANVPSICWYDSEKTYIGGSIYGNNAHVSVKLPETAKYIRVSVYKNYEDNIKVYSPNVKAQLSNKADITALGTQEGVTASKLYHPGEHFYKNGKFCTVIGSGDVALGTTWTLNTNYVEGTVAELLNEVVGTVQASADRFVIDSSKTKIVKKGNLVTFNFWVSGVTIETALSPVVVAYVPDGFQPKSGSTFYCAGVTDSGKAIRAYVGSSRNIGISCAEALTNENVMFSTSYYID